jgi:hypothetical protein
MKVEKGQLGKSFSGSASALKNLIYFSISSFRRICSDVATYSYLRTYLDTCWLSLPLKSLILASSLKGAQD